MANDSNSKRFFDNPWVQRFLPSLIIGAFIFGGVWYTMTTQLEAQGNQIESLEAVVTKFQSDMHVLQIEQSKDNDFRNRGDRFSTSDGTKLESSVILKNRDYTDKRIKETMEEQNKIFIEIKSNMIRLNDKLDEMVIHKP